MKRLNLKLLILERFQTQFDFAKELGIRDDKLSKIIQGRVEPNEEEKEHISMILGVPVDELFEITNDGRGN